MRAPPLHRCRRPLCSKRLSRLSSDLNPSNSGQLVTITAVLAAVAGNTPTGSVTFMDNGAVLGAAAVDSTGAARVHTAALSVGNHTIAAVYAGDRELLRGKCVDGADCEKCGHHDDRSSECGPRYIRCSSYVVRERGEQWRRRDGHSSLSGKRHGGGQRSLERCRRRGANAQHARPGQAHRVCQLPGRRQSEPVVIWHSELSCTAAHDVEPGEQRQPRADVERHWYHGDAGEQQRRG